MEARPTPLASWYSAPAAEVALAWIRGAVLAAIGLLWLTALLLVWRRLSGGLTRGLDAPTLVLGAAFPMALAAAAIHVLGRRLLREHLSAPAASIVRWGPALPLVLITAALWIPGSSLAGLVLLSLSMIGTAAWTARPLVPAAGWLPAQATAPKTADDRAGLVVWQQFTRLRDAAGHDVLEGRLRTELAAGERTATLHVAFCPPFARVPELEVLYTDGPASQVKPSQVLPYGARLDVRLDKPAAQATSLMVEFVARGETFHS